MKDASILKKAPSKSLRHRFVMVVFANVHHRCNAPNDKRYVNYGGKGIECRLTIEDLYALYERDRPDLMIRPSIDRKDSAGHYEFENCRFIELYDNIKSRPPRQSAPCENCSRLEILRQVNGKRLCSLC